MKKFVEIPEDTSNYLESLYYELNATKDVVVFMIRNNMVTDGQFEQYHDIYKEASMKYEMAKKELEEVYIIPNYLNCLWELNFNTHTLEIEVEDNGDYKE